MRDTVRSSGEGRMQTKEKKRAAVRISLGVCVVLVLCMACVVRSQKDADMERTISSVDANNAEDVKIQGGTETEAQNRKNEMGDASQTDKEADEQEESKEGSSMDESNGGRKGTEEQIDTAEEERKIESFVEGKRLYNIENDYEAALGMFTEAMEKVKDIKDEKMREAVRRAVRMYRAKALFELGRYQESANETIQMQVLNKGAIEMFQKALKYASIDETTPEREINEALRECSSSPYLLKLRINMRIKSGEYGRALLDIRKLAECKSEIKSAERLQMHCNFLRGNYDAALRTLEKQEDCKFIHKKVKDVLSKYDATTKKGTVENYQKLKRLIDVDILVAKAQETKFKPSIYNAIKKDAIKRMVGVAQLIGKSEEAMKYSKQLIETVEHIGEEEYALHIELLIRANKFQTAKAMLDTHINAESPMYEELKVKYNSRAKKVREEKEKKEKEKREKEQEELEKSVKEAEKKEKERCERRRRFVAGRRGKVYDPEGFYKLFELPRGASEEEVNKAYMKLARKSSMKRSAKKPKEAEEAKQKLIAANKAKEVLMNKDKKAEYDSGHYMTDKEKEAWGYNDEAMERYGNTGGDGRGGYQQQQDLFDILMGGGSFGGGFGGGFGGFDGGNSGFRGGRRVVYYM